ncbi:hypothetical protein U1Q18_026220 [Sarracenia purpurea var. burkii]
MWRGRRRVDIWGLKGIWIVNLQRRSWDLEWVTKRGLEMVGFGAVAVMSDQQREKEHRGFCVETTEKFGWGRRHEG